MSTTKPEVSAVLSDPDGNDVRTTIQAYTSTAATTKVSECTSGWVTSGQRALCTLGTVPDNTTLYVRASVQDGNGLWAGVWSPWQEVRTGQATPAAPTIACSGYTNGQWAATAPTADVSCTIKAPTTTGNNQAIRIDYRIDGATDGTPVAVTAGQSVTVKLAKAAGGHQIRARTATASGMMSDAAAFTTGWGGPSVIYPAPLSASNGTFAVTAMAPARTASETSVSAQMQWRTAGTSEAWKNAGAAKNVTAAAGAPSALDTTFDAAAALAEANVTSRGPVRMEFQVCFTYTGVTKPLCTSDTRPTTLVRIPHAFGDGYPTTDVEAGQVALYTGEFQTSATDATVPGYGSDITVTRSHLSYTGPGDVKAWPTDPVTGVFGPGFTANLEGDDAAGLADLQVIDQRMTDGSISLIGEDGEPLVFVNPDGKLGTPTPATLVAGTEDTETSGVTAKLTGTATAPVLAVAEDDGTTTSFTPVGTVQAGKNLTWHPASIAEPGQSGTTTFGHDPATGAVTRIVAPLPDGLAGSACPTSGTLAPGCRAMDITYTTVTDPNGKQAQRISQISAVMYNATSQQVESKPITSYTYDSQTRLSTITDVRSGLSTTYTWDGTSTRIKTITPSGLAGYTMTYAANPDATIPTQVVKNVSRGAQTVGGSAVQIASIVYDVPVSGSGLPDLSENGIAAWVKDAKGTPEYLSQKPVNGYAVFDADHPVTALVGADLPAADLQYAGLQYINADAYTINSASYGAGAWQITADRYDAQGNVIRSLDASAITAARADASLSSAQIDAMSTQTTYNADITAADGTVLTPAGTLVTDTYAPARDVLLADGTTQARVRPHVHTTYDEGAPNGGINAATGAPYRLPTTVTTDAVEPAIGTGAPAVVEQLSVTTSGYTPIDGKSATDPTSGWTLGVATASTNAIGQTTRQRFDARGKVVEQRQPASNGTDAGTTKTIYYTAAANADDAACGATDQAKAWAGLVCRTFPAAAPSSGPTMPGSRVTGYDFWLAPTTTVETSGSATRTSEVKYDAAGRSIWTKTSTSGLTGSQATPAIFTQYNQTTGLVDATGVSNAAGTAVSGAKQTNSYDLWGKQTVSVNELGDTTTTTYDDKARVTSITDPKGTTTFEYNGSDANGKAERRGVVTKQTVTRTSSDTLVYQAAYDANGAMTTEKLPAGITATHLVDEAGEETGLVYSGQLTDPETGAVSTGPWIAWSQTNDAAGRVRTDATTFASAIATTAGIDSATDTADPVTTDQIDFDHRYSYDKAGNLTKADDLTGLPVAGSSVSPYTTREYTFTTNGARKSLNEQIRADGTASGTATAGVQQQLTYDTADRPTGGYVYDLFGRQTTVPAAHAPNSGAGNITLGYFDSDLPASVKQGSTTTSFTLDVNDRRLVQTSVTGSQTTMTTRHYTDGSDNPSWIDVKAPDGSTTTTRYTSSVSGDLGASITSDGAASLALPNIHGDIVTTIPIVAAQQASVAATRILGWSSYTEYGTPIDPAQTKAVGTAAGYGWLGAKERSTTEATAGLTLMGVRLYDPFTGSFSSVDPVPGGNYTSYTYPSDPLNERDLDGRLRICSCLGPSRGGGGAGGASSKSRGGYKPVSVGLKGEAAAKPYAGVIKNTKKYSINGRKRIPDYVNPYNRTLIEVKNVKKLKITRQLRDFKDLTKKGKGLEGYSMRIYVRAAHGRVKATKISPHAREWLTRNKVQLIAIKM